MSQILELDRPHLIELLESITEPFAVLDDELRIVFLNRAAADLIGRAPEELLGKRADLPETRDSPIHDAYRRVLETREPVTIEYPVPASDRWYEASIYPLKSGLSVLSRDVTGRRRARELADRVTSHAALRADVSAALADARDMRRTLQRCCEAAVAHLGVAFARVWTADEAGKLLLLDASAGLYTHLDGAHAQVPVGKFKIGLIAEEKRPHLTNDVQHDPRVGNPEWATREGMVAFAGYPLLVDGRMIGVFAMFARAPLAEDTLSVLGSVADAIAQGIVRRRTELELERRVQELARSNADLEQFAYVASHDLQEPLRMVSSYVQLLARRYKGKLDSDADDFIGFAVEGASRMQRLINDLLAYSRVGTRPGEHQDVDLERVFATACGNLEQAIADQRAEITHDPLPSIAGNETQLVQLLQNLLSNAIKFHGDLPPRVHVSAERGSAGWTISVRDNGIGISSEYFERIFVIFQRLHPREIYDGTGIGLAISKRIVERHGGRIWVESTPGAGATISFTLAEARRRFR
ncbi:MAG: PAS domain-containing protein [Deltaproteobacteria bacterium]|nr:PAS domain-containing protein [Deltaproteobacteria bacterium]